MRLWWRLQAHAEEPRTVRRLCGKPLNRVLDTPLNLQSPILAGPAGRVSVCVHYDNKCVLRPGHHPGVNVACLNVANCVYLQSSCQSIFHKYLFTLGPMEVSLVVSIIIPTQKQQF